MELENAVGLTSVIDRGQFVFTARRYASAVFAAVRLSVRHKPVSCRNDWTNRAGFGMEASFYISHTVKFGYLLKLGYFPLGLCSKLWT